MADFLGKKMRGPNALNTTRHNTSASSENALESTPIKHMHCRSCCPLCKYEEDVVDGQRQKTPRSGCAQRSWVRGIVRVHNINKHSHAQPRTARRRRRSPARAHQTCRFTLSCSRTCLRTVAISTQHSVRRSCTPSYSPQASSAQQHRATEDSGSLTTAILKIRLRASIESSTFQTPLRAPATVSKNESHAHHAHHQCRSRPAYHSRAGGVH